MLLHIFFALFSYLCSLKTKFEIVGFQRMTSNLYINLSIK